MTDRAPWCQILNSDARRLPFADRSVDLVFGSPPYQDARTYGIRAKRRCVEWVDWMLGVVEECQRVCSGPVVIVAAGVTRKRCYQPGCEGVMWEWYKRGGDCELYRPVYWHRFGIPGSGGNDWFRADVEYVMCFKRPGELPWSNNKAMGHPPRWAPGGAMSHRLSSGARVNQWDKAWLPESRNGDVQRRDKWGGTPGGTSGVGRRADGRHKKRVITRPRDGQHHNEQAYSPPALANPGNLVKTKVGGGSMGSKIAHENEAPFPERLAEFFIRSLCPPGGIVLDPFSGSGTTAKVALAYGRNAIATDIRLSECEKSTRRVAEVQTIEERVI